MKPFTKIAAVLLGFVALLHLLRLISHWNVIINNYEIPVWVSIIGFIIAGALSMGLWKEAKQNG
ncbi:MAG: hypothetical protein ACHQNT_10005 [Bacteroidia bacterium]